MTAYIARRLLLMIPTLLGITLAVFFLIHLVPGGPVERAIHRARVGAGGGGPDTSGGLAPGMTREAVAELV